MLFTRRKKPELQFKNGNNGTIKLNHNAVMLTQTQMIKLTPQDLGIIKNLKPYVEQHIDEIVNNFYKNMEITPSLMDIINKNSSVERLRVTLRRHIIEMFEGRIDQEYVDTRIKIAHIHADIGLKTKWYLCAFQDLLHSLTNIIEKYVEDKAECFLAFRAVSKILNFEQQLVIEAYDARIAEYRDEEMNKRIQLQERVASAVQNLAAISQETNASYQELITQSHEIVNIAQHGTQLSESTESNALSGKTKMIEQQDNMKNVNEAVDKITNDIQQLLEISQRMQSIIEVVRNVADSTNLLSLNASIEAARAGEAGRGFAVVAEEVRKLSDETKESTQAVSNLITDMNQHVDTLTITLRTIRDAVGKSNESMETTNQDFEEIMNLMSQTKEQNKHIETELEQFVYVIRELGKAFNEVTLEADGLTTITDT